MGYLKIKKVKYEGDKYYYYNDKLDNQLNIILGNNGNGKSTFTFLIYYGLGNYLPYFEPKKKHKPIKQIAEDENNFVELEIEIDNNVYSLVRYINKNLIKVINITTKDPEKVYPITRNGKIYEGVEEIFSDWLMGKLGISKLQIEQYGVKHHINFEDLMRLIYFDQKTSAENIFKSIYNERNYFKNSSILKCNIFETLICRPFVEYYKTYFDLKELESKKNKNIVLKNRIQNLYNISNENIVVQIDKLDKIKENYTEKLISLEYKRETLKENRGDKSQSLKEIEKIERNIYALEIKKNKKNLELERFYINLQKGYHANKITEKDITHLNKILFTSKNIKLFDINNCPFCKEEIKLDKGKCLCGSDKGLNYEKFIYSDEEYEEMLKSKYKTSETIKSSIQFCSDEILRLKDEEKKIEKEIYDYRNSVEKILKNLTYDFDTTILNNVEDEIFLTKSNINQLIEKNAKLKELSSYDKEIKQLCRKIDVLENKLGSLANEKQEMISENYKEFGKIFTNYINDYYDKTDKNAPQIYLNSLYIPEVKFYKENSAYEPIRFYYYLSLLRLALEKDIAFPRFLIIDGFDSNGLDSSKIKVCYDDLKLLVEIFKKEDFQIIITNRHETFPDKSEFDKYIKEEFDDDNLIFKDKNSNIIYES